MRRLLQQLSVAVLALPAGLVLSSCETEEGPTLSRLTEAWAEEALDRASPMATASVLLGAISGELCVASHEGAWANVELGGPPPLSLALRDALGDPQIKALTLSSGALVETTLSGVTIGGREDVRIQVAPGTAENGNYALSIVVLDPNRVDSETGEPDAFGRTTWTVESGCAAGAALVNGAARWVDLDDRSHSVDVPADSEITTGMRYNRKVSWVPSSGTLAWSSRLDGQEVSLTTDDAEGLELSDASDTASGAGGETASWEVVVRGAEWNFRSELVLDP